jgi:tetratricopeptide (TPR) repeat protein
MNGQTQLERPTMWSVLTRATLLATVVAVPAEASPVSRARTQDAYALAYNLQFAACYEALDRAAALDPLDPAPLRAIAAVTWIEILFAQGVATYEAFTGEVSKNDVARPRAPEATVARFHRALAEARRLANAQAARADDADAHYQVGATEALGALFSSTVEGRLLGSFTQGRRAVAAMERARAKDPARHETALVLGMFEYTVSTMSWPVRTLARLSGLSGNRSSGLALLTEASAPGAETESDALLLLMIVDHREGRPADALSRLEHLRRRHPGNRLLWLNHGASALAADRPREAVDVLSDGLARHALGAPPFVLGEGALWFAHRGTALARLHHNADALADLQRGLLSAPRDWVRGRIHRQLGDLATLSGESVRARREYTTALALAESSGDDTAAREATQRLAALDRAPRQERGSP